MRLILLLSFFSLSLFAANVNPQAKAPASNSSTASKTPSASQTSIKSSPTNPSSSSPTSNSSSETPLDLKAVMSPSVQEQTGVNQLSSDQVSALGNWFSSYLQNQKNEANEVASNAVSVVLSEGHYVKLGSGAVWNISPNAWLYTYYWQKGDPVKIGKSKDTLFPVSLTNENTGQEVNAQKASKDISQAFTKSYPITKISSDGQFITLSDGSSWQVEPSARYMSAGWSQGNPIFVVKVKNATGSPFELYNGATTRSVFVRQIKAPTPPPSKRKAKSTSSTQNNPPSSRASLSSPNQMQPNAQTQGSQS